MWQTNMWQFWSLWFSRWDFPVLFLLPIERNPKARDNFLQPDRAEPVYPVHGETPGTERVPEEQNDPDYFHHK